MKPSQLVLACLALLLLGLLLSELSLLSLDSLAPLLVLPEYLLEYLVLEFLVLGGGLGDFDLGHDVSAIQTLDFNVPCVGLHCEHG